MKKRIDIEVNDIKITEDGYYSFNWAYTIDKKKRTGHYSNDFDGQTAKHFKEVLESGYAFEIVLEQIVIRED